jgi:hypothetical protein
VRYATTVANRFGARVKLLHVVEDPFVTGAWSSEAFVPNMPGLLDTLIKAAQQQIAELKKRLPHTDSWSRLRWSPDSRHGRSWNTRRRTDSI